MNIALNISEDHVLAAKRHFWLDLEFLCQVSWPCKCHLPTFQHESIFFLSFFPASGQWLIFVS